MTTTVRKAVVPAAGLGTRSLPLTKAQPKEMLPLLDKPAIQYVVEEAAALGIRDVLLITSRGKASLEDHFDRAAELERQLEAKGKLDDLERVRAVSELARVHAVRQAEPKGLGHAVSLGRDHVGDEPFVVLLPDDIVVPETPLLARMVDAHARRGATVLALLEVPRAEISAYGCARVEPVDSGPSDGDQPDGTLVRVREVVEKPAPEEAPSTLAVVGRYILTPGIFEALGEIKPGRGGELQLTDAIGLLLDHEPVYGVCFSSGRYDVGNRLDYLRANVELGLARADLGPALRAVLLETLGVSEGPE